MDFSLTDEQQMLRDTARSLFERECPPTLLRASLDDPVAADPLWSDHLSGWMELATGDVVDLALFMAEHGRAAAPGVFFPTAVLFAEVLAAADHPEQDEVLAGTITGTVAMAGTDGIWAPNDDPVKRFVPEADRVDRVAFVLPGAAGPGRPMLGVVDATDVGSAAPGIRQVDTFDLLRRTFDVAVPPGLVESADLVELDPARLTRALERALVMVSAELIGVARWLLDAAVAYSKERVQFDRPIGSFQGLQWKMVDAALELERADAAVSYAAMCVDADDPDRHRAVHGAKAQAGLAARRCARDSMQVHGGIGYTWEHDLHLRLRRAWAGDAFMGPSAWHHDRLAELLFA